MAMPLPSLRTLFCIVPNQSAPSGPTRASLQRVTGGAWCTVTDADRWFSYRRDGVTGRMAASVWIERPAAG